MRLSTLIITFAQANTNPSHRRVVRQAEGDDRKLSYNLQDMIYTYNPDFDWGKFLGYGCNCILASGEFDCPASVNVPVFNP